MKDRGIYRPLLVSLTTVVLLLVFGNVGQTELTARARGPLPLDSHPSEKNTGAASYEATTDTNATAVFEDDFSNDPNSSGKWTVYRYSDDPAREASWDMFGKTVYLTRAVDWKGVAMYANYNLIAKNWEAEFRYKAGGGSGADGFTFFFYKDSRPQKPSAGGNLGFHTTLPNSGYAIEFDNWAGTNDPSANHIALVDRSVFTHVKSVNDSRTEDNNWHQVLVQFDEGHVSVTVDGSLLFEHTITAVDYTFSGIGFSASTGNWNNNHVIDDFVLRTDGTATSDIVTISGVEATQAIQCANTGECFGSAHSSWCPSGDCTNAIPLLIYKPTWVRVYVKGQPDGVRVKASLEGHAQNGDSLPGSPISSPFTVVVAHPDGGDRGKPGDSFNFRLPVEWTLYDNITLQARVYLAAGGPSVDSRELALAFTERNHMPVYSWRFRFPNVAATTQAEARAAARFTAQVYPVNDDVIDLRDQGELETKAVTWQGLAADLAKPCADALRKSGYPAARCYGWVPKDITMQSSDGRTYYGWTDYGVSVGYVYRPPLAGGAQSLALQYIMAHEIGHTFAPLNHVATASCGGSGGGQFESQFPNATGSIGQYGFYDDGTARVYVPTVILPDHPVSYFDFMSYCGVDANRQWVSPHTYRHLYDALGDPYLARAASAPVTATGSYLIASGVITPSGSISLNPFYQEQYPVGSYDAAGTGTYRLELQDAQGNVLFTRFFDQTAPEWLDAGAPIYFFEIMPFAPGATKVVIKQGAATFGQVSASSNPPQVTLVQPQPGAISGDTLQIGWTGNDVDGDAVKYMVEYSADGGQTWQTLAFNLANTSLTVKTADLPGSDQAKVRVLASDGLNTTVAESGLLLVPTKVPRVTIISPDGGAVLTPGQPISLSGIAEDRDDGTLDGAALTWTLDSGAAIGSGRQLTLFNPPAGRHTITLTAQDGSGNTASTSIPVFVGYQTYLPLTVRGR